MTVQLVEITHRGSGSTAKILISQGFNCFSWNVALDDGPREMLWAGEGFDAGDKRPSSGGIPFLFPFPGRIGGACFEFDGRKYQLEPGDAFGNAIHGFVLNRPWRVVKNGDASVAAEFQASIDDPTILDHWPADFKIQVSYEIRAMELVSEIRYSNPSDRPLPCGFATHAYFRIPLSASGSAADTVITAPVAGFWELEQMIPTGRILPVPHHERMENGLRLGDHKFDTVFTRLHPEKNGRLQTRVADPASGRTLTQSFDSAFTQCVIYTPAHREAICLEPYTCVPDAIRLAADGHETGLQILQPGEEFSTTIRLQLT